MFSTFTIVRGSTPVSYPPSSPPGPPGRGIVHPDGRLLLFFLLGLPAVLLDEAIAAIITLLADEGVDTVGAALEFQFRVDNLCICIQFASFPFSLPFGLGMSCRLIHCLHRSIVKVVLSGQCSELGLMSSFT